MSLGFHARLTKIDFKKITSKDILPLLPPKKNKNHGHTFCNDVTTTTTTIKQYEKNHNNQFDPIILALPHPITVLLCACVLVSFAFFDSPLPFCMFPLVVVSQNRPNHCGILPEQAAKICHIVPPT